ncbi:hypothetical protein [Pontibacter sp. G13]|uniref:hypothetical protein n=1 Tax=Pontibacter sp. G13 TaxID=3074898 RepID=UPI00288A11AC|nr:hypothetical protein [Pontibacter sp. G13]WNJ18496.1 hypothetical protein RJD25_26880 [Pontibacter sp. G13]
MKTSHFLIASFMASVLFWTGCQLNPVKDIGWNADVLAPLAYSRVDIFQAVQDSSLLETGPDDLLQITYRDTLVEINLAEIIELPDTGKDFSVRLDTLTLDSDTVAQQFTLGQLAQQLANDGNIFAGVIIANHGGTLPAIPNFPGLSSGAVPVDASEFFTTATLSEGTLSLTLDNQFPLDLANVTFEIRNLGMAGPPLVSDVFDTLRAGTSETRAYDLAGKTLLGDLEGELVNMDLVGGNNVPVDTTDYVEIRLAALDMKAQTATAVFPGQVILDTLQETRYSFGEEFSDVRLTKLKVRTGTIRAIATSTVEDTLLFRYGLPSAVNDQGETPSVELKLDPAPSGGVINQTRTATLEGFTLDMTGTEIGYNTLLEEVFIELPYSGNLITLEETDSVVVTFELVDIEPIYVEGYLGQQQLAYSGSEAVDFFDDLDLDRLYLSDANAALTFENSMGLDASLVIRDLSASNSETGESIKLSGSPLVAGPIHIPGISAPDTFNAAYTTLELNSQNSNIVRVINVLADEISYELEAETNISNPNGEYINFATEDSRLAAYLDLEIPVKGLVEGFKLADTVLVDFGSDIDLTRIDGGMLRLIVDNGFPFEVELQASLYTEDFTELVPISQDGLVEAATVENSGRVESPVQSVIEQTYSSEDLTLAIDQAKYLVFEAKMRTRPSEEEVAIFADYELLVKLVGQFSYQVR